MLVFVWILYLPAYTLDLEKNYNVQDSFDDCLLLFNSDNLFNTDINFGYISEFYGLSCRKVDLSTIPLSDGLLKNKNGNYIKSICAAYFNLSDTNLLDTQEINLIKNVINDGSNLIITEINDSCPMNNISILTDYLYNGAEYIVNYNGWHFTNNNDSITSAFTNSRIIDNTFQEAYDILADNDVKLVTDTDETITIFSYLKIGNGKIFLDGNIQSRNFDDYRMCQLYNSNNLNNILPLTMFLKYSNGNQCWHNNHRYTNLTIDDPYFIEHYGYLNFHELLNEMEEHDFHTTIAYIPKHFDDEQDTSVINLFKNYPERYSIVQHGNNHNGYEFICYTQEQLDTLNATHNNIWLDQTPRPYIDQEDDIVEGYTRLCELHRNTEINFGKIMIFPWGISLSPTLELLKMYNFNATVNGQNEPYLFLEGDSANNYDFNMRLANMNFRNFPVVGRKHPCSSYDPINYRMDFWKYNLFLDKPLLMYSHHSQIFKYGIDKFNPVADSMNQRYPSVEWKSLGFIVKKMYLEKNNDDGSIDVMFYGNNIIISNETDTTKLYHLKKIEELNVPIYNVTVDGDPVRFTLIDSILQTNIDIPPHTEREITINYYSGDKDFIIVDCTVEITPFVNIIDLKIFNNGNTGGTCPIGVYNGKPEDGDLLYLSVVYVQPFNTEFVQIILPSTFNIEKHPFYIFLDPFDVILERDEDNNIFEYNKETLEYLRVFPNPFIPDVGHDKINFEGITKNSTVEIYDIIGREVWKKKEDNSDGLIIWSPIGITSGIYVYIVKNNFEVKKGKIIIIK